jgi:hypothetical protein
MFLILKASTQRAGPSSNTNNNLNGNLPSSANPASNLNDMQRMPSTTSANSLLNCDFFDEPLDIDKDLLNSICFDGFPQIPDEVDVNNNNNINPTTTSSTATHSNNMANSNSNNNININNEKRVTAPELSSKIEQTPQAEPKENILKSIERSTSSSYDLNNISASSYNLVQVKSNSNLHTEDPRYSFYIKQLTNLILKILHQVKIFF